MTLSKKRLGVNIDHIATLRKARGVSYPDPVQALPILKDCQVDQVTIHLREDRRHIVDRDLELIAKAGLLPVNLEIAVTDEMVQLALKYKPDTVTFVPEKREEVTTEGGLDCINQFDRVMKAVKTLSEQGIRCSLFIDPDAKQVVASKEIGAQGIEIHTGAYCNVIENYYQSHGRYQYKQEQSVYTQVEQQRALIRDAAIQGEEVGLEVYAGHGLHMNNLEPITEISQIAEYNIGHAIIARAVFVGLSQAIQEIQNLLK